MMELKNIYYQLKYHNQEFGSFIENYLGTSADALKEHIAYVAWEHVYNNNNSDLTDQERYDARYSIDIDAIINNVNELEQKVAKLKNKLINLAKKMGLLLILKLITQKI